MKLHNYQKITRPAVLGATTLATAFAFNAGEVMADDAPSHIHELINLEFASEYVTPRGMIVHDQGLTFQPLALTLVDLYSGGTTINSIGLVAGAWNDFGTHATPVVGTLHNKSAWTEIDPIAGLSFGFLKKWKLDVTYSAFAEQIGIGTDQNLEAKLSFDDSSYLGAFALHPSFSWWDEVGGSKSTDADTPEAVLGPSKASGSHPAPGLSYYFDLDIDPSYTFTNVLGGLKVEAPSRVMFPDDRFYGDYYSSSSAVGIWQLGLKGTIPMNFMPAGYGHWSFHAGVNFLYFQDDNLVHLESFLAPNKPTRDTVQGFAGVSVFF